jgi:hypothetical protein
VTLSNDQIAKQKINKKLGVTDNTMDQLHQTAICKTLNSVTAGVTFFSSAFFSIYRPDTVHRLDNVTVQKTTLNKLRLKSNYFIQSQWNKPRNQWQKKIGKFT